ncbi:hypothetical protein LguiA_032176 [Lonicera macranthoides]
MIAARGKSVIIRRVQSNPRLNRHQGRRQEGARWGHGPTWTSEFFLESMGSFVRERKDQGPLCNSERGCYVQLNLEDEVEDEGQVL